MAVTQTNMTPLHASCEGGRAELVRYLLDKGVEKGNSVESMCNMRDADGKSPFDLAMAGEHKAVVKILKDSGDPNAASAACIIS